MAVDLDLPQRGVDDDHWDQKLNAALTVLKNAVNAALAAETDLDAEVQNALASVSDALSTMEDALSVANAAQASVTALSGQVSALATTVGNLQGLLGGTGHYPMFAIGDVARPTSDPNVQVFWTHSSAPAAMLDIDLLFNLPDGVTL